MFLDIMNNAEVFNPLLKQRRVQEELKNVRSKLYELEQQQEEVHVTVNAFQAIQQRNILKDAPTELIVKIIMHIDYFEDVESLLDAVPRVKTIFVDHNLIEYCMRKDFPRVEGISDMFGFMKSKHRECPTHFEIPAGKYIIGSIESTLAKDIYEDLWKKKEWNREARNGVGGLYSVNDYNKKSGNFSAFYAETRMCDSDGHIYRLREGDHIGCIPFSLVKKAKRVNAKIIESKSAFEWRVYDHYCKYLKVWWKNMDEETKSLKICFPD
jgi:hypothetical protein